jgi:hypothetical protein
VGQSCEIQRAVIYLFADRDCYRGAGSHVPACASSLRSAPSAAAFDGKVGKTARRCLGYYVRNPCKERRNVDAAESKDLQKGTRVCWQGNAADRGTITQTSWDAVTITWDNGHVAIVHHGDMREIRRVNSSSSPTWGGNL